MISVFSKQADSSPLIRVALSPGGEMDTAAALRTSTHGEKEGKVVFVKQFTQNLDQDQTKKAKIPI